MLQMPVPSPFASIQKKEKIKNSATFELEVVRKFNQQGETEQRWDRGGRAFLHACLNFRVEVKFYSTCLLRKISHCNGWFFDLMVRWRWSTSGSPDHVSSNSFLKVRARYSVEGSRLFKLWVKRWNWREKKFTRWLAAQKQHVTVGRGGLGLGLGIPLTLTKSPPWIMKSLITLQTNINYWVCWLWTPVFRNPKGVDHFKEKPT